MDKKNSGGFLQTLIDSLFGGNDKDAEKRRQLKAISKRFSKCRFNKFYKFQGNEALPMMPKFFFEIYKVIYPAQTMFQSMNNAEQLLKNLVIDYFATEEIRQIEDSLTEDNIMTLSHQIPVTELKTQAMERLQKYSDFFSIEKINTIDNLYKQLITFKEFCTYDFYMLLKKFNKIMKEADFGVTPAFEKINAEYIIDEIKDFISVAWSLPLDADWTNLFQLLRKFKGVEPVTLPNWKKVITRIVTLRQSGALEMMIRLISGDPRAIVELPEINANIIEPHLDKLKDDTERVLNKLIEEEKNSKANDLSSQLFTGSEASTIKNYTDALNATFERKGIRKFLHYASLNYLKQFLIDIFKKDMKEYYDLVVIRGKWESQALSGPFSDAYNSLLGMSEKIINFDNELAETGPIGMKIKTLLPKTERDSGSRNIINRLVTEANEAAYNFLIEGTRNIITMGKIIKALVEDYVKPKPVLISNWKELEKYCEQPLKEYNVEIYKKIALLANLLKTTMVQPED